MIRNPQVAIIILNWNQYEDTSECLRSIGKMRYENYRVIVVDNNSSDGSCERLEGEFRDVIFLKNSDNLGFAGGMNMGIDYVLKNEFDHVLILNSDTVVSAQLLYRLVDLCGSEKEIGIAGPVIFNYYRPKEIDYAGGAVHLRYGRIKHLKTIPRNSSPFETEFMTGCCMMIPVPVIKECGIFDSDLFLLCEDLDISLRYRNRGYKIFCDPKAVVWHKISTKINRRIGYYFWFRNILIVIKRHSQSLHFLMGALKIVCLNAVKCIITSLFKGKFKEAGSVLFGIRDFFRKNYNKGSLDKIL